MNAKTLHLTTETHTYYLYTVYDFIQIYKHIRIVISANEKKEKESKILRHLLDYTFSSDQRAMVRCCFGMGLSVLLEKMVFHFRSDICLQLKCQLRNYG